MPRPTPCKATPASGCERRRRKLPMPRARGKRGWSRWASRSRNIRSARWRRHSDWVTHWAGSSDGVEAAVNVLTEYVLALCDLLRAEGALARRRLVILTIA